MFIAVINYLERQGAMFVYNNSFEIPDVVIDYGKCDLCVDCVRTCPMQSLAIKDKKIVQKEEICFGCRNCEAVCEKDAITVKGTYRVLTGKRRIGYIYFRGFPAFTELARDKAKLFQK